MRIACVLLMASFAFVGIRAQDLGRPGAQFPNITADGIWTWYGEPKAIYFKGPLHERTYVSWITRYGDDAIASYDHATKAIQTFTLHPALQADDHDHPSIHVRPDGVVLAFYSRHSDGSMMYRMSNNPEDVTSWATEKIIAGSCTYPNVMGLSAENNKIYVFRRGSPNVVTSADGGNTWSPDLVWATGGAGGYIKYCTNNKGDEIHWAYEQGHRRGACDFAYAKYRAGAYYRADNTKIKDLSQGSLAFTEMQVVYDVSARANSHCSAWDIAVDSLERPVIVYANGLESGYGHKYWYVRWNGTSWEDHFIVDGGSGVIPTDGAEYGFSGGVTLDHADPRIVYVSRNVKKADGSYTPHEIEQWSTADGGNTWKTVEITKGSAKLNMRPCVPRAHPSKDPVRKDVGLIWLYGDYKFYSGTGNMNTAVKYCSPPNPFLTTKANNSFTKENQAAAPSISYRAGAITVFSRDGISGPLRILDLNGAVIRTFSAGDSHQATVRVSDLVCGMYLLRMTAGGRSTTKQILISEK
jgi:hypothetical protein